MKGNIDLLEKEKFTQNYQKLLKALINNFYNEGIILQRNFNLLLFAKILKLSLLRFLLGFCFYCDF